MEFNQRVRGWGRCEREVAQSEVSNMNKMNLNEVVDLP